MMVIFLVGLVSMILMRTLRKDYARYSKEEDLDDMVDAEFHPIYIICQLKWHRNNNCTHNSSIFIDETNIFGKSVCT